MNAVAKIRASEVFGSAVEKALFDIVKTRSFRRGKFKLSSGAESELYFNLKPTMMSPKGAHLSARAFLSILHKEKIEYVGGLEMGAVPIISSLAAISDMDGTPVKAFFVRKQPKSHGTMDVIEGLGPTETLKAARVMIADDVATTGGSIVKAVNAVRAEGAIVDTALVLVDREEGAKDALAREGVRLLSVFRGSQFL